MRGYISRAEARERVLTTLRFLHDKLPNHRGFFYHFANVNTGERIWDSEISSVDTAILLCGILCCRQHFENSEIRQLCRDIFDRVDWTWLSEDTTLLPHGWLPEAGFLPYRWDYYSELMMMYLLGMGSSSHPLNCGPQRRRRFRAVSAAAGDARPAQHPNSLSAGLEYLRIRERLQPAEGLVRQRRDRHRHRYHAADGGECPHRPYLEYLYEKP